MIDICVPLTKTRFTIKDFLVSMIDAWKNRFNTVPTKEQLAVLWGQYSLETGGGGACWNYNIGNYKKRPGDSHSKYCMLPGTWEMVGGKKIIINPPDPGCWFRSYDSLEQGVEDYILYLSSGRYASSWPAVLAGSPEAFAHQLKIHGFYTADEYDYGRGVRRNFNAFMKIPNIDSYFAGPEPAMESIPVVEAPLENQTIEVIAPDMTIVPPSFPDTPLLPVGFWGMIYNFIKNFVSKLS